MQNVREGWSNETPPNESVEMFVEIDRLGCMNGLWCVDTTQYMAKSG